MKWFLIPEKQLRGAIENSEERGDVTPQAWSKSGRVGGVGGGASRLWAGPGAGPGWGLGPGRGSGRRRRAACSWRGRARAGARCRPSSGRGPADSAPGQEVTQKTVRDVGKRGPRWVRNREGPPRFGPPALLPWAGGAGEAGAGGHRAAPAGLRPQRAARRVGGLSPAPGPREPEAAVQSAVGGRQPPVAMGGARFEPWAPRGARGATEGCSRLRRKGEGWEWLEPWKWLTGDPEDSPVQALVRIHL